MGAWVELGGRYYHLFMCISERESLHPHIKQQVASTGHRSAFAAGYCFSPAKTFFIVS